MCQAFGLGLLPWSPLAGGMLGGVLQHSADGRRASERTRQAVAQRRSQLQAYEALCRDLGDQPGDVAVVWLLHNPVVTAPIVGPRTLTQLTGSMRALEIKLTDEVLTKLDEIWPGPGGQAPEACAW